MPKVKDLYTFVRFGGLDLKNQKGYKTTNKTFHSPPVKRGFYAMPKVAQEFFLLGGMRYYQPGILPEYGDDSQNWTKEQWKEFNDRCERAMSSIRKEFCKKDGNVWHHLIEQTPANEILDRDGSWIKTSMKAWGKAFGKMSLQNRYGEKRDGIDGTVQSINEAKGITGWYSKDHCEVFFDEKV